MFSQRSNVLNGHSPRAVATNARDGVAKNSVEPGAVARLVTERARRQPDNRDPVADRAGRERVAVSVADKDVVAACALAVAAEHGGEAIGIDGDVEPVIGLQEVLVAPHVMMRDADDGAAHALEDPREL